MRARQNAATNGNRPHGTGIAAVNARLAIEDLAADDIGFQIEDQVADVNRVGRIVTDAQRIGHFPRHLATLLRSGLLAGNAISIAQLGFGQFIHLGNQRLVLGWSLPGPFGLAGDFDQFVDRLDRDLHLIMAEDHGAQHHFLRQFLGLGFDHQHGARRTGDNQVELALSQLAHARTQHILAADVADAGGTDRAIERNAGNCQCCRSTNQCRNIRIDLRVARQDVDDHLDFVVEAVREQRPNRPVNQARGQRLLLGGTAFALEEAARNAAGSVDLLNVIDGQRKKILTRLGLILGNHGGQNNRVIHRDQYGAGGLARHLAGLQRHGMRAVGEGFLDRCQHNKSFRNGKAGATRWAAPEQSGLPNDRAGVMAKAAYLRRPRRSISAR